MSGSRAQELKSFLENFELVFQTCPEEITFHKWTNVYSFCYGFNAYFSFLINLSPKQLNVKLENIMTYALVGGMKVPPGALGYKRGVGGQMQPQVHQYHQEYIY